MERLEYKYRNCPIHGGGYVTGILFHPTDPETLYIRTDIGGLYRFDFFDDSWVALNDNANIEDPAETFPLAIALDPDDANLLISVCGTKRCGDSYLTISTDKGNSFVRKALPDTCTVHGNEVGRSTGERLLYDKGRIWFASQTDGLLYTDDFGESWRHVDVFGEKNCSFIAKYGEIYILATDGEGRMDRNTRAQTLFYSIDGLNYSALPIPAPLKNDRSTYLGFVPQRSAFDGESIYITFAQSGTVIYGGAGAYSCDTGSLFGGRVYRYDFDGTELTDFCDVTPDYCREIGGFGGIDCSDGKIYACSMCSERGDRIFVSSDKGASWEVCLGEGIRGGFDWTIDYMKPEYSNGKWCIHWLSDFKVSTFNKDFALFNTGCGVFATRNLTSDQPIFFPLCDGLEETVHLSLLSPPSGEYHILDLLGDLGGFVFKDPDTPCEKTLCDENGNRYITCFSADFPDENPEYIIAAPRGNWAGTTKTGLILSTDSGKNWRRLPDPKPLTLRITEFLHIQQKSNSDGGHCAISADGKRIFRALSDHRFAPSDLIVFTDDEGMNWRRSDFSENCRVHILADRIDPDLIFAVGTHHDIFISRDKGENFSRLDIPAIPYKHSMRRKEEFRTRCARRGELWIANGLDGLYRISVESSPSLTNLLPNTGDYAACVGFGSSEIYICGKICGEVGFFRSDDDGATWIRINDEQHQFGDINTVCGDPRVPGRIYIGSASRGLVCGDMI